MPWSSNRCNDNEYRHARGFVLTLAVSGSNQAMMSINEFLPMDTMEAPYVRHQ
jgi:hypothetical protein